MAEAEQWAIDHPAKAVVILRDEGYRELAARLKTPPAGRAAGVRPAGWQIAPRVRG